MTTFTVSLYQGVGGLFLFLVCSTLYASRRRPYFLFWTLAWCCFSFSLLLAGLLTDWDERLSGWAWLRPLVQDAAGVCGWWHPALWVFGMLYFWRGRGIGSWQPVVLLLLAAAAVTVTRTLPPALQKVLLASVVAVVSAGSSALLILVFRRQGRLGALILAAFLIGDAIEEVQYAGLTWNSLRATQPFAAGEQLVFVDFLLQTFIAVSMIIVLLDEEQLALQDALRSLTVSEDRFRLVFEHGGVGMALLTADERFIQVNPALERLLGYASAELCGRRLADLANPDDSSNKKKDIGKSPSSASARERDKRFIHKDGRTIWAHVWRVPVRDERGQVRNLVGVLIDITARKQAEEALRSSARQYRQLVETSPDAIVCSDLQFNLTMANPHSAALYGVAKPDELIGRNGFEFAVPEDWPRMRENAQKTLETGILRDAKYTLLHRDGSRFPAELSASLLVDSEGRPAGFLSVIRDISGHQHHEAELQRAKEAAETANRAKSEFLANISHEIRTPMNAIVGMTEMTLSTKLSADQREYLEIVKSASDSLLTIINDILDFSKMEARKLHLHPAAFDLRDLVANTVRIFGVRARQKNIDLVCQIHDDVPSALIGDSERLRQVLVNLVGNAVKFTERGRVTLDVSTEVAAEADAVLQFAVADTGIGIAPRKLQSIFQPFEQSDVSTTRRYGGTGLGLAICANLVRLMDGRLWVESEQGQGSTFRFTARFQRGPSQPPTEAADEVRPPPTASPGIRRPLYVLLVEDNPFNQKPIVYLLEKYGHRVVIAANGKEALALFQMNSEASAGRFDLVLMDVRMPEMDGLEATAGIRAWEHSHGGHVHIIAMTAHGIEEGRPRCLQAGMDGYVAKPVQARELWRAIEEVLPGVAPPEQEDVNTAADGSVDKKALLSRVDGNPALLQEIIALFLRNSPLHLEEVRVALAEKDVMRVTHIAHNLKGEVSFFSAGSAADAAKRLETTAASGDWPEAEKACTVLRAEIERLQTALANLKEERV